MPSLAIDDNHLWTRRFLWLLAAVVVFRIAYLFLCIDFQLAGDETYYWDWGRQPDWGYFSKPPLIAWIMAAIRLTFGYTWWAVRLTAILFGSFSLALLFMLGRAMFDARTGFVAALLFVLTPACAGLNLGLNTDPPLLLCWGAALLAFWRAVESPQSWWRWLVLAICIGIGSLAKQMMLVFPLLMILFASAVPAQRSLLKRPAFWLCIVLGAAFLLPTMWWNKVHDWPMVKHTEANIGASNSASFVDHLANIVTFPATQFALFSPPTLAMMIIALIACWRRWKAASLREQLLWVFSAPALIVFVLLSFYKEVNPNWPATFYLAALVMAAAWVCSLDGERHRRWMRTTLGTGAALTLIAHLVVPAISWAGLRGSAIDRFRDLRGWDAAGQQVATVFASLPKPDRTFILVADHRHFVSQLAFWMPQHPRIYRWNDDGSIESQYEIWPNASDKRGWDVLIVLPNNNDKDSTPRDLRDLVLHSFRDVKKVGDVNVDIGNGTRRAMQLFLGHHMVRWPPSLPPKAKTP